MYHRFDGTARSRHGDRLGERGSRMASMISLQRRGLEHWLVG